MNGKVEVFKESALREAFEAGRMAAMSDASLWREAFKAGELRGREWALGHMNAPNFFEYMSKREFSEAPDYFGWLSANKKELSIPIEEHEFMLMEAGIKMSNSKYLRSITIEAIEEAVTEGFGIDQYDLRFNKSRKGIYVKPRHHAWYLAYHHCDRTLSELAYMWGRKDHSSVSYGVKTVRNDALLYEADMKKLLSLYKSLRDRKYNIYRFTKHEKNGKFGVSKEMEPIKLQP